MSVPVDVRWTCRGCGVGGPMTLAATTLQEWRDQVNAAHEAASEPCSRAVLDRLIDVTIVDDRVAVVRLDAHGIATMQLPDGRKWRNDETA
jgi:hypothetical protein